MTQLPAATAGPLKCNHWLEADTVKHKNSLHNPDPHGYAEVPRWREDQIGSNVMRIELSFTHG